MKARPLEKSCACINTFNEDEAPQLSLASNPLLAFLPVIDPDLPLLPLSGAGGAISGCRLLTSAALG